MSDSTALNESALMAIAPHMFGFRVNYVSDLDLARDTGLYGYVGSTCKGLPEGLTQNGNVLVYRKDTEIMQILYPHATWKGYIEIKRVRFTNSGDWGAWYGIKGERLE